MLDFSRADAHRFCGDFTRPIAERLALRTRHLLPRPSGPDCDAVIARLFALAGHSTMSQHDVVAFLRHATIRDVQQHGRSAVARIALVAGMPTGNPVHFAFSDGRWRIAQVPQIEGAYFSGTRQSSFVRSAGAFSIGY